MNFNYNNPREFNLDDMEKDLILKVMKVTGIKIQACKILGITDRCLRDKIKKHGIKWE